MVPLSGILLSYSALAAMSHLAQDALYDSLYCECRVGTLARATGYTSVEIRPDATDYISWQPRYPDRPGIWHSVKSRVEIEHLNAGHSLTG